MYVSPEELIPGSDAMKARAKRTVERMGKQFILPDEAGNILAGIKSEASTNDIPVLFVDVRTRKQQLLSEIAPGLLMTSSLKINSMVTMLFVFLTRLERDYSNGHNQHTFGRYDQA